MSVNYGYMYPDSPISTHDWAFALIKWEKTPYSAMEDTQLETVAAFYIPAGGANLAKLSHIIVTSSGCYIRPGLTCTPPFILISPELI